MYPPPYYTDHSPAFMAGVMREHSFAVLTMAGSDGAMSATHLPLIYKDLEGKKGTLYGHIATSNPQAALMDGPHTAFAVFSGPHAYISAMLYDAPEKSVPTWDYTAVHARGVAQPIPRADYMSEMETLVQTYEDDDGWTMDYARPYAEAIMNGIIYFKMPIASIQGIRKLSQNKPRATRERISAHLRTNTDPNTACQTADAIALTL